jgi:hypothetical protein
VTHDRLARLQKQARQVAVDEWGGLPLFNMLIDWSSFDLGVFHCFCIEGDKGRCLAVALKGDVSKPMAVAAKTDGPFTH